MLPKIYVLPVPPELQPPSAAFRYPSYSRDWGIEQDFDRFLRHEYPGLVPKKEEADFLYLPVFWTRYHLNHDYGRNGRELLRAAIEDVVVFAKDVPCFTVCQYDDGPLVDLEQWIVFLGSRKVPLGRDAPLLASPMPRLPKFYPQKRDILANFLGRDDTHPIRGEIAEFLRGTPGAIVSTGPMSIGKYFAKLRRSRVTVAPRGYGGSSFRFFEAIQVASVPWLIGEFDTRPFKNFLDWDAGSFFSPNVQDFVARFPKVSADEIGAKRRYLVDHIKPFMVFRKWCWLVVEDLNLLRPKTLDG